MTTRNVWISTPSYGPHEPETMASIYFAPIPRDQIGNYEIQVQYKKGCSLLANAFNGGWVDCLNDTWEFRRGNPDGKEVKDYHYWFMLHGDIEPDQFWVHTMIEELELHDLDVLHAVCAIKDNRGITSTGVGPLLDKWSPTRKVTTTELHAKDADDKLKIPRTFVCGDLLKGLDWSKPNVFERLKASEMCLLPNTGCLLVKIAPWCWEFPGFVIEDRIVEVIPPQVAQKLDVPNDAWVQPKPCLIIDRHGNRFEDHFELSDHVGKRMTSNIPEDWGFGRWCARKGLKVGGTTVVGTRHHGPMQYTSGNPWGGEKEDRIFFDLKGQWKRANQDNQGRE